MSGVLDAGRRSNGPGSRRAELDGGLGIERPQDLAGVHRFSHEAMATIFEVHAVHPDAQYAAQAAAAAFGVTDSLERELSRFLPNSDIARINRLAAGERTRVSPSTMECLVIARHVFDLTGGAFDIATGTGLPRLDLDADTCMVRAPGSGARLDLGGIGKGYAVDAMAELLNEWGLEASLVHGGFSSVLALEPPGDREGWPLTLSDPAAPSRVLVRLRARHTALGASGKRKGEHILDPRRGQPARGRLAAWVALPRPEAAEPQTPASGIPRVAAAALADALATAFMLLGPEEIEGLCARNPGLEAWILPEEAGRPLGEVPLWHFTTPAGYTLSSGVPKPGA